MPQVSRKKLPVKVQEDLLLNLMSVLSLISRKDEMDTFLLALMTDVERLMFAKRLAMVLLISDGYNDSDISNMLYVTRVTVAKFRYYYESRGRNGYEIAFTKLAGEKEFVAFKSLLVSLAKYSVKAAGGRL